MYPILLDLTGKKCLVVGAGPVGRRKVSGLVAAGALVRVVDLCFTDEFYVYARENSLELYQRGYCRDDLDDIFLVFACSASVELQERVAREAKARGLLVNSATDPEAGDFTLPAQLQHGDFLLTISTGGSSPALARKLQRQLAKEYGPEYGCLVKLFGTLRPLVLAQGAGALANRELFRNLLGEDLLGCIVRKDWALLLLILQQHLPGISQLPDIVKALDGDEERAKAFYE